MGFSFLGALGGAAKQLTTEYTQDRLDEKRRQAQMLSLFAPELINERKSRRLKKNRMREQASQLSRFIPKENRNLLYNVLATGEAKVDQLITDLTKYEQQTGTRLDNIEAFKKLNMLPQGYEPPEETYENFDDFFNRRIAGNITPYISDKSSDLQKNIAKSLGARNPKMLKDSVYADLAAMAGPDISTVASDVEGTREIEEAIHGGILRAPLDPLTADQYKIARHQANATLAAMETKVAFTFAGRPMYMDVYSAKLFIDADNTISQTEKNRAKAKLDEALAGAGKKLTARQKLVLNKIPGMQTRADKRFESLFGGETTEVSLGQFRTRWPDGLDDQKVKRLIGQAGNIMVRRATKEIEAGANYQQVNEIYTDEKELIQAIYLAAGMNDGIAGNKDFWNLLNSSDMRPAIKNYADQYKKVYDIISKRQVPMIRITAKLGANVLAQIADISSIDRTKRAAHVAGLRGPIADVLAKAFSQKKITGTLPASIQMSTAGGPDIVQVMDSTEIGKQLGLVGSINSLINLKNIGDLRRLFQRLEKGEIIKLK